MSSERLLRTPSPIVAAPMAGGPSNPALAAAVAGAGGFPFLAGGYKHPDALAAEIAELREHTAEFGVNLFVPAPTDFDVARFRAYAATLQPEADVHGLTLDPEPVVDDDHWHAKLELLLAEPVPLVSFTFALPERAEITALRRAGSRVLATVTAVDEALAAQALGVDGLVVQGPAAGGHSATHTPARPLRELSTEELLREVRASVRLPVVAAGGVDGPEAVARLLTAGAEAVAVGTLLLRTDEAGTSPTHRAALDDPAFTGTVLTRAFTGRPARALRNGFVDRHDADAPDAYPAVHHLTRALRQAAGRAGDADRLHLWAGTGYRHAPEGPAAQVIAWLSSGRDDREPS